MLPFVFFATLFLTFKLGETEPALGFFVFFIGAVIMVELMKSKKTQWVEIYMGIGVLSVIGCAIMAVIGVIISTFS
jgi:hypothetical protein